MRTTIHQKDISFTADHMIELSDTALQQVHGGVGPAPVTPPAPGPAPVTPPAPGAPAVPAVHGHHHHHHHHGGSSLLAPMNS